jgi:hypothetical protein
MGLEALAQGRNVSRGVRVLLFPREMARFAGKRGAARRRTAAVRGLHSTCRLAIQEQRKKTI